MDAARRIREGNDIFWDLFMVYSLSLI